MSISIVTGLVSGLTYMCLATDSRVFRGFSGALAVTFFLIYLRLILKDS